MNLKYRNWFLIIILLISVGVFIPSKIYAIQGQLNYDVGTPPQEIVTVEDTKAIQECNSKLNIANQTRLDFKQQKDSCLQTNSLLNKAMKESIEQTTKQKNLFTLSLIILSVIACAFFLSTILLLVKLKNKKIQFPPPNPTPSTNTGSPSVVLDKISG